MDTKTGKIGVTTDNIFPVIKKFLYSDHEIFLRELVSNAIDATQKLRTLSSFGEYKGTLDDMNVRVTIDKEAGTLTVSDHGIGMTAEDIDKYINRRVPGKVQGPCREYNRTLRTRILLGVYGGQESRDTHSQLQGRRSGHDVELRRFAGVHHAAD